VGTFSETPEALLNSLAIAEMVDFMLPLGEQHLPKFSVPEGYTENSYLRSLLKMDCSRGTAITPVKKFGSDGI